VQETVLPAVKTPLDAARNGYRFYKQLQTADGHFPGEYGGPMFLIPGLVIVMHITKTEYLPGQRAEFVRYLRNRVHLDDGGWGMSV
jgi:lanosterol synthase